MGKEFLFREVSYGIEIIYSNDYDKYDFGYSDSDRSFDIFQKEIQGRRQKFSGRPGSYAFVCDGAGAGHGGLEMFVILSLGMINNLIYSVMINLGQTQTLLDPLDEASRNILQTAFDVLIRTPSWQFVLSPVERLAAITAQIGLSVIVWYAAAAKKSKAGPFVLAILLHAVLDGVAVLTAKSGMSLIVVEVFVWLIAIGITLIARNVWKKETQV